MTVSSNFFVYILRQEMLGKKYLGKYISEIEIKKSNQNASHKEENNHHLLASHRRKTLINRILVQ